MTFFDLVKRLKREAARSNPSSIVDIASLDGEDRMLADWVGDALLELERAEHGWPWMVRELVGATVAGQLRYTVNELSVPATPEAAVTNFGRWAPYRAPRRGPNETDEGYTLLCGDPAAGAVRPLQHVEWSEFNRTYLLAPPQPGVPAAWALDAQGVLHIGPQPDAIYPIRATYYRAPQALVLDADVPELPAAFHPMLIWSALMDVAAFDAATEVYARAKPKFDDAYQELRQQYGPRLLARW